MANIIGYYHINSDDGFDQVAIVLKDFWETNMCLDDRGGEESFVPARFYSLSDAIYEHDFDTTEEARVVLESAGFVEKDLMS